MPYCPDCGVEIGHVGACPLCGAKNPNAASAKEAGGKEKDKLATSYFLEGASSDESFTPLEQKKITWEVISIACAIAIGALGAINLLLENRFSWSLYPISTLTFAWMISTAFLMLDRQHLLRDLLLAFAAPLYFLALGAIAGNPAWALDVAVPLAFFIEAVVRAFVYLAAKARRKGLNLIAHGLTGVALICVVTELLLDYYFTGRIQLGWSAIVSISLIPVAGFLLYLHYRVAKATNLHRLFRL
ncbi:MAG: DUF6320 domain-containing protein [Spirochaetaceae bacterium]|nr:DUF6320 domain-containing protein [Spirochaetaceae bacterium]